MALGQAGDQKNDKLTCSLQLEGSRTPNSQRHLATASQQIAGC